MNICDSIGMKDFGNTFTSCSQIHPPVSSAMSLTLPVPYRFDADSANLAQNSKEAQHLLLQGMFMFTFMFMSMFMFMFM